MSPDAKPTDFSAARIHETVQQVLTAGVLPAIVQAGHPVLRQLAAPFDGQLSDAELGQLIDLMRSVMHKAPGVGLAAPQLGIPLQLAVLEDQFDVDPEVAAARGREPLPFFAMLNPTYQPTGGSTVAFYEGCLSVNGLQAAVSRPEVGAARFHGTGRQPGSSGSSRAGRRGSSSTKPTTCTASCTWTAPSCAPSAATPSTPHAGRSPTSASPGRNWGSCRAP